MRISKRLFVFALGVASAIAAPAWAQSPSPSPIVEAAVGYAGFVDEVWDKRLAVSGAVRAFVTPRLAVGPEFLYLHGFSGDRDWTLTGNASFDLRSTRSATFYLIAGGGVLRQTRQVGTGPYTSREGTFSGGVGARIAIGERFYIAPEARFGIEPEIRVGVTIGRR